MTATLIGTAELAARMNLNPKTIRRLVDQGRLPAVRICPGKLLFDPAEVERALHTPQVESRGGNWPRPAA